MPSRRPSQMTRAEFVSTFRAVFEHSPWVAEQTFDLGLHKTADTLETMHAAMCKVLRSADPGRQLGLMLAHPDLAGKLALAGDLSAASANEQAGAGLDQCTPEEFERIKGGNARYKERFGFPFIMAVKGSNRAAILAALEARLGNDPGTEFVTALREIECIALFRLEDILGDGGE